MEARLSTLEQQPCNFEYPQQDLAKNPLTDEALCGSYLFCSFSTPRCKTYSLFKYNMVCLHMVNGACIAALT